ncbi:MAG: bifunctional glutamate N-acetyltransferase/amino-acid acetyltransferase ArgJ [Clostridia bacterium]|nr:bifunctional glutamate N-acetyltransferase/amino-acid acetyltransferase ArgJ [Clostridia bacterium]
MKIKGYEIKKIDGGITAPTGFMASGVSAGIKKDGTLDIALLYSETPASAAAVFTRNRVKGHSLLYSMENIRNGTKRCIFINSGNANACIGEQGIEDAKTIADICSSEFLINKSDVLTASTGVIGFPLPMDKVIPGIKTAAKNLSREGGSMAARAIMTTDTYSKEYAVEIDIDGKNVRIGGMAKGSGMIHPNMATMIAVLTTDAAIEPDSLNNLVRYTADISFNRISIDGDTSVCDTMMCLANGTSGFYLDEKNYSGYQIFKEAFTKVCIELAKMIVLDGEGATKLLEIKVLNALDKNSAERAARAIANSPLVKTAFYGEDANWGRILTAAGYSGAKFNPSFTTIKIGSLLMFKNGRAAGFDEKIALEILKKKEIVITVDFGEGQFNETIWTCDLSHKYVDINSHYRS